MKKTPLFTLVLMLAYGGALHAQTAIDGPREIGMTDTCRFSVNLANMFNHFEWTPPTGCRILKGQGTGSIELLGTFLAQDGPLSVVCTRTDGNSDTLTLPLSIYRKVSKVEDHTVQAGTPIDIDGQNVTEADIYYTANGTTAEGRPLYTAHRLTVIPPDEVEMTKPYLQTVSDTSIWITWKTRTPASGQLVYGIEGTEHTATITTEQLGDNYYWHSAHLTSLTPDTKYRYHIERGDNTTPTYDFRTAPVPGSKSHMRILLMGDHQIKSRSGYEWLMQTAKRHIEERYGMPTNEAVQFIMNVGDQVDDGTLTQYEQIHLNKSALLSPYIPIMTCVGNHETYHDTDMKLYSSHYHYEDLAYNGITSGTENYYAYRIGRILFVVLSTEHTGTAQKEWVRKIVDAVKTDDSIDFVVSVNHRPIQAEQYIGDISGWVRNEIIPILCETPKHVLNFGGHHHLYHRGQLTDYPLYHIINGAASWNQLWGMSSERDYEDVQKTIDYWGYQILDFDFDRKEMKAECYAIGNKDIVRDNLLIDSFSRTFGLPAPERPEVNAVPDTLQLPYTVEGSAYATTSGRPLNTVQLEVSATSDFSTVALSIVRDTEDLYGSTGAPLHIPIDVNENVDITKCTMAMNSLKNGTYYLRMRYRDDNMEWSEWSDAQKFTVTGSIAGDPSISIDRKVYAFGETITINYHFAPKGQNAWVGVYKKGQKPGPDASIRWAYTSDANGTMSFTLPSTDEYFAVLFEDGGYTEITPRMPFLYGSAPTLSTDKSHYEVGEPIRVHYTDGPGLASDWIGIYRMGETPDPAINGTVSSSWAYIPQGATEGDIDLSTGSGSAYELSKGYYYVGYFTRGGYFMPSDSITISVGDEISEISADKTNFSPSEDIIVHYNLGPGTPKDWMGFYEEGKTVGDDELDGFYYTYGATKGDIVVPAGTHKAGNYFVGLYINDSYTCVSNLIHLSVGKAPELSMKGLDENNTLLIFSFDDDSEWRDSLSSVILDGRTLNDADFSMEAGVLKVNAATATDTSADKLHDLRIQATAWQDATLQFRMPEALGVTHVIDADNTITYDAPTQTLYVANGKDGEQVRVYAADGTLHATTTLKGQRATLPLNSNTKGIWLIHVGSQTLKINIV